MRPSRKGEPVLDFDDIARGSTRRQFLGRSTTGIGVMALASLMNRDLFAGGADDWKTQGALPGLHFAPKAKRIIYLFMSGGPSQIDLFDPKPVLKQRTGEELPASVRNGQRITGMTSGQAQLLMVGASNKFVPRVRQRTAPRSPSKLPGLGEIIDDVTHRPVDADRPDQPRPRRDLPPHRQPATRPADLGLVGLIRPWAPRTRTCPNTSSSFRVEAVSPCSHATGATGSCRANIKASRSVRPGDPVLYVSNPEGIDQTSPPPACSTASRS